MVYLSRYAVHESEEERQANAELFGFVEERLAGWTRSRRRQPLHHAAAL